MKLIISDTGIGFEIADNRLPRDHYGLIGMRERVESVEGMIEIKSSPGYGTTVSVSVPTGKVNWSEDGKD